jgi:hypothetical protein
VVSPDTFVIIDPFKVLSLALKHSEQGHQGVISESDNYIPKYSVEQEALFLTPECVPDSSGSTDQYAMCINVSFGGVRSLFPLMRKPLR